jgi:hypothetical protein
VVVVVIAFFCGFGAAYLVGWLHLRSTERQRRHDEILDLLKRLEEFQEDEPRREVQAWVADGAQRAH